MAKKYFRIQLIESFSLVYFTASKKIKIYNINIQTIVMRKLLHYMSPNIDLILLKSLIVQQRCNTIMAKTAKTK